MQALTSRKISPTLFGERAALQVAACGLCSPATGGTGAAASCGVARAASRDDRERPTVPLGTAQSRRTVRSGCFALEVLLAEVTTRDMESPRGSLCALGGSRAMRIRGDSKTRRPIPPSHHVCACACAPSKRRLISNPSRPGEPGRRLVSLPHAPSSPVTRSRKSSSSHARATLTFSAPLSCFSCSCVGFFRRRFSRAHPTHVPLGTAHRRGNGAASAARACARCARRACLCF